MINLNDNKIMINAWSPTVGDNAGKIIRIFREDGVKRADIVDFNWYFYTEKTELARGMLDYCQKEYRPIIKWFEGENYIRVYYPKKKYRDPNLMKILKHLSSSGVTHYEGDLGPMKRFFLDNPATWVDYDELDILYFDIETDDSNGQIEYEYQEGTDFKKIKAKDRILSIAGVDRAGNEYFFSDPDESSILRQFDAFLRQNKIDMLVGYNSKDFDLPYIQQRMQQHQIDSNFITNILHLDMYRRIQDFYKMDSKVRQDLKSYSLNSVSDYFLKEQKIPFSGKVKALYDKNFSLFKEYNIQDCRLVKRLEETLGVVKRTHLVMSKCGCKTDNWSSVKVLDTLLLSYGNFAGDHFITNPSYLERIEKQNFEYMGGFVLDPVPGFYNNVWVFDFNSLYPSIMQTFNISPDSYLGEGNKQESINTPGSIDPKTGEHRGAAHFRKEDGAFTKAISSLLEERAEIRSKMKSVDKDSEEWREMNVQQLVVKEVTNSIYGVLGNQYFRGFNINLVESVTGVGQYLLKHLRDKFQGDGRVVVYGDTDSIFFVLRDGEEIEQVQQETNDYLAEHITKEFGTTRCTVRMGIDKHFDKFLISNKKTYCGVLDGKMKYVGLELIKRDTIGLTKNLQKRLIEKIFDDNPTVEQMKKWLEKKQKMVMNDEIKVEDLVIYKRLNKDAKLYKGKVDKKYTAPIHVRVALETKKDKNTGEDLTKPGAIIPFIITEGGTPQTAVHLSNYEGSWDREHYWNSMVYTKLEKILSAVYPDEKWKEFKIKENVKTK